MQANARLQRTHMRLITLVNVCALIVCAAGAAAAEQEPSSLIQDANARIPPGARVFIAPIEGGYDIYLSAAMHKKEVPVVIVSDKAKADFELSGVTESEKAGWAKVVFWGNSNSAEQASVKVVNLKTGTVVWG